MRYWIYILRWFPFCAISRLIGRLAQIPFPRPLMQWMIKRFIGFYHIDVQEILVSLTEFSTLDQFFTRELQPDSRPINLEQTSLVSPVDGHLERCGSLKEGVMIQAKGINYSLQDLVPSEMANHFTTGSYLTIYLSPQDCHRIFSPVDGAITGWTHIPGTLYPVCSPFVKLMPNLFTRNERLISYIQTSHGLVAVVKVGAFNVGKITLAYDESICTNQAKRSVSEKQLSTKVLVERGQWMSTFHLGSTVILLLEKPITWQKDSMGKAIRYGEAIGQW